MWWFIFKLSADCFILITFVQRAGNIIGWTSRGADAVLNRWFLTPTHANSFSIAAAVFCPNMSMFTLANIRTAKEMFKISRCEGGDNFFTSSCHPFLLSCQKTDGFSSNLCFSKSAVTQTCCFGGRQQTATNTPCNMGPIINEFRNETHDLNPLGNLATDHWGACWCREHG